MPLYRNDIETGMWDLKGISDQLGLESKIWMT